MEVYTIGFTKKTAEQFFETLRRVGIRRLIDVRLHNSSQLASFTKRDDLAYFLRELCGAGYAHEPLLAPTPELFDDYRKRGGSWTEYERRFNDLITTRGIERLIDRSTFEAPTVLLCSEPTPERCHRRLVVEYLRSRWGGLEAVHL